MRFLLVTCIKGKDVHVVDNYQCPQHKVISLQLHINAIGFVCLFSNLIAAHAHSIVTVSVIPHVPSQYNRYNIFIACILSYGSPWAQDIKRASDCLPLDLDGEGGVIYSNAVFSFY